jgi:ABC-type glycerol-3-phosphate transport system substrate-binding protein
MKRVRCALVCCILLTMVAASGVHAAKTTLSLWSPDTSGLSKLVAAFEQANPDIEVSLSKNVNWANHLEKYAVAIIGGAPPDLLVSGLGGLVSFAEPGWMQPLDELIEQKYLDDIWPGFLSRCSWKGHLYGIVYQGSVAHLLYSTVKFEESGLRSDKPPTSWDEVIALGRKLVRYGTDGRMTVTGFDLPRAGGNSDYPFVTFLQQKGGSHWSADGSRAAFNSQAGVEALDFYASLFHEHMVLTETSPEAAWEMLRGNVAMGWTQGPGNFATMRKIDPELAEQWKCAQLPYFDKQMYMAGGSALLIPVGAKSTEAAVRFIKFVMQPETVNFAAKELMYAPFKSLLRSNYAKADPDMRTAISAFEYAAPNPPHPQWTPAWAEVKKAVDKVLRREMPSKPALDQLCVIVDEMIAQARASGK